MQRQLRVTASLVLIVVFDIERTRTASALIAVGRPSHDGLLADAHTNVSGVDGICHDLAFLRIQKTGSTTLAGDILPAMCERYGQHCTMHRHIEFNEALRAAPRCIITMIRDPVERFISEFMMTRGRGSHLMMQDQWDYHDRDMQLLKEMRHEKDMEKAKDKFLRWPANPARNRQALYLLGFTRLPCTRRCCKECSNAEPLGYPALAYDWDKDHDELLARAKDNLLRLHSFGVTDCYVESMKFLAQDVGWDPTEASHIAEDIHRNNQKTLSNMRKIGRNTGVVFTRSSSKTNATFTQWRQVLSQSLQKDIRDRNRIDDELVAFGKKLLYERHGIRCD